MKTKFTLLCLLVTSATFAAFGPPSRVPANAAATPPTPCPAGTICPAETTAPITLNALASSALLFQVEEERLARELYTALGAKHALLVFQNIQRAETRHEEQLRQLATRAGLPVPPAIAGVFTQGDLAATYASLRELGLGSPEAALRAGALVEEKVIADLRDLAQKVDDATVLAVLRQLETASGHHLAAFVRQLAARGVTYTAQVLTAAEVNQILAAQPGRGQGQGAGASGNGRGYRGGR